MRHTGLTTLSWVLLLALVGLGVIAGHLFAMDTTANSTGITMVGFFVLCMSLFVAGLASDISTSCGHGEVVISGSLGTNFYDLVCGEIYAVVSCTQLAGKLYSGESNRYIVVLKDTRGTFWSCALPEEPPAHFIYTQGEKRFVPYTPASESGKTGATAPVTT